MKAVANWFKAAIISAMIWLSLAIMTGIFQLLIPTEKYDNNLILLLLDIIEILCLIVAKFGLIISAILYLWKKVEEYDKEQELAKLKIKQEKEREQQNWM